MLDEPATEVALLQVTAWIQRMNEPELIARAAGRHIVPLLGGLVLGHAEYATGGSMDHRQEDHVAFIALELRSISSNEAPSIQVDRADKFESQRLNQPGLFIPK